MSLRELPPSLFRPTSSFLLCLCLVIGAAGAAAASPARSAAADPGNVPPPPAAASCWEITGPFTDGRETYFKASNQCDSARHCQVWVNGHEPPFLVHLEPGASGRIDVGAAEEGDSYSKDCAPIGIYGDHND